MISAAEHYGKRTVTIDSKRMAYVDVGNGLAVVFLHGNPTSSYLWRNVIPHVEPVARCIAPDLIGMGDSAKLTPNGDEAYRLVRHIDFLDGFLEALGLKRKIVLVGHDWGSVLAFDWARRHEDRVAGIVYMEAIVTPFTWEEFPEVPGEPESSRAVFQALRSDRGEEMILDNNYFVESRLPTRIIRDLGDAEMEVYRRPYRKPGEDRRPTLTWARELPISREPADVTDIVEDYASWLTETPVPKLFIRGEPGGLIQGPRVDFCRTFPNQTEISVAGIHFLQEDSPDEIGLAIVEFIAGL